MLFLKFSQLDMDINDFCQGILNDSVFFLEVKYYLKRDPNWIGNHVFGTIQAKIFLSFIERVNQKIRYSEIFLEVLEKIEGENISDMLFQRLLSLKKGFVG